MGAGVILKGSIVGGVSGSLAGGLTMGLMGFASHGPNEIEAIKLMTLGGALSGAVCGAVAGPVAVELVCHSHRDDSKSKR